MVRPPEKVLLFLCKIELLKQFVRRLHKTPAQIRIERCPHQQLIDSGLRQGHVWAWTTQ
jgi:hypothetical protein